MHHCNNVDINTRSAQYAVSVIKRSSVRPYVRPSVCSVDRQQRRSAGLLLRSGAERTYRSIAAAAARDAGRVNFGPTARTSNILFYDVNDRFLTLIAKHNICSTCNL